MQHVFVLQADLLGRMLRALCDDLCRNINERYFQEVTRVAFRLLEVFAIGLGLEPTALHHLFQPTHTSFLRLNYYPVTLNAAPHELGISPHKDAGFLTVLVQDSVAGLQVGASPGGVSQFLTSKHSDHAN